MLKHVCCLHTHHFPVEAGPSQAEQISVVKGCKGGKHGLVCTFALPCARTSPNTVSIFTFSLVFMWHSRPDQSPCRAIPSWGQWSEFGLLGTCNSLRVGLSCGSLALLEKGWMRKGGTKLFAKFVTLSYTAASLSDLHSSVCSKHETAGLCIKAGGVLKASCLSSSSCIRDHVPVQVKSWLSEQFMSTYRCCCMGGMQGGCQNLAFTIKSAWWFWNLLSGSTLLTSVSATWNRFQPPRR